MARGVRARSGSADDADEERALLRAIASRDEQALHDLYRRRSRELLAYLIGLCPDEQIAQELLQDTMLKVWRHAKDFRAESSVRTWLYAIARRTARDFLRATRPVSVSDERLVDEAGSRADEPEAVVLARADAESVIAGFAVLSPLHREVLLLVAYRGLSVRETAQVLGIAEGTVKSRLHHARQALTAQLGVEVGSGGHEG